MQDAENPIFRIGDVEVDASRRLVSRGGVPVYLRQQALEVLLYLLRNPDRLVTRQELFDHIWKDTAVTDDAVVQCVVEIRKALGDEPRRPRFILTVPKSGYRLIAPVVRTARETPAKAPDDEETPAPAADFAPPARRRGVPWVWTGAAAALLIVSGVALYVAQPSSDANSVNPRLAASPGQRRVAVAPFEDVSSTADLTWLRQGLPDMFVTNFAQIEGVRVLDRQQIEVWYERMGIDRNKAVEVDRALDAAKRGNAELLVVGSFAAVGPSIRIEARVHEVATGAMIGADSIIAARREDILAQADILARRTAVRFAPAASRDRGSIVDVMTTNLEAYRCYVLGLDKAKGLEAAEAIDWFQKAVRADPQFAMAYGRIGYTYAITLAMPERARPYLEKAFELSARLTDKDRANITAWYSIAHFDYPGAIDTYRRILDRYPEDVEAYWRLGLTLAGEDRLSEAIEVLLRGRAVDPQHPEIHNALGGVYLIAKRHPEAIATLARYAELDPTPNAHDSVGLGHFAAGDYRAAIAAFERSLALKPDFEIAIVHLGNTYVALGRYREALETYDRYIKVGDPVNDATRGHGYKGWIEYRRGRVDAAWRSILTAAKVANATVEGIVIALEKDPALAKRWYEEDIQRIWPGRGMRGSLRHREYLTGRYTEAQGDLEAAFRHFARALQSPALYWNVDDYETCLADAYLRARRFAPAIAEYERILAENPHRALPRFHLAQALEQTGERDRALAEYRRFLEVWRDADRDLPEVRTAAERVAALTSLTPRAAAASGRRARRRSRGAARLPSR
jgi:DNA-binding winged helix-turn-helix (wHTH) protein/tetratricopeptide (TPR) repeat protein